MGWGIIMKATPNGDTSGKPRDWDNRPPEHDPETTRPSGRDWDHQYDPPTGPPVTSFPRVESGPQVDTYPGEYRAYPAAVRRFGRFTHRGDASRRAAPGRPNEYQGDVPDWSLKDASGRQERKKVTAVHAPNPGAVNADWAGVMNDPMDAALKRDPVVGDWWIR